MSAPQVVKTLVKSTPNLARMGTSLFWTYLTLGWKVRKARRAFEKQLVSQGMSKEDAKRLSECFSELKNNITRMLYQGVTVNLYR